MMHEIIISGFGGQGVMAMGKMLAEAGMQEGLSVNWLPSYGPEVRGRNRELLRHAQQRTHRLSAGAGADGDHRDEQTLAAAV